MRCDVCYRDQVTHMWPCNDFDIRTPLSGGNRYTGEWAMCRSCAALASKDDWAGIELATYRFKLSKSYPRELAIWISRVFVTGLLAAVTGPPKPVSVFTGTAG